MTGPRIQSEAERERILDAHRARQQEAYWGVEQSLGEDDERYPANEYELECQAAAGFPARFTKMPDWRRRDLVLAWLATAEADSVRDYMLDAMSRLTPRDLTEYLVNVVRRTDKGQFSECLALHLEASLASFIQRDINTWRLENNHADS